MTHDIIVNGDKLVARVYNGDAVKMAAATDLLTALEVLLECSTAPHWKKQLAKKAIKKATS